MLKAVGRREHLRQGVAVRLPGRQDLRLSVFDGQRTRNQLDRPILLFPNRSQDLTLQLANHGGKAKSVVVNLYAAQQKSLVAIPRGAGAADLG